MAMRSSEGRRAIGDELNGPLFSKSYESAIEEVVGGGCQERAVDTFLIVGVAPRLAVARNQVDGIGDTCDPAVLLDFHDALFEQPLP
jgi:hypothetical protein